MKRLGWFLVALGTTSPVLMVAIIMIGFHDAKKGLGSAQLADAISHSLLLPVAGGFCLLMGIGLLLIDRARRRTGPAGKSQDDSALTP